MSNEKLPLLIGGDSTSLKGCVDTPSEDRVSINLRGEDPDKPTTQSVEPPGDRPHGIRYFYCCRFYPIMQVVAKILNQLQ